MQPQQVGAFLGVSAHRYVVLSVCRLEDDVVRDAYIYVGEALFERFINTPGAPIELWRYLIGKVQCWYHRSQIDVL